MGTMTLNVAISLTMYFIGTSGLVANVLLIINLMVNNHLNEPSSLLMLSAALADAGHEFIILCHVAPELAMGEIAWGEVVESMASYANLFFWYASLGSLFFMAINRYFAVCRPLEAKEIFKLRKVAIGLGFIWTCSLGMGILPLGVCCRKIFDIHYDFAEEESHGEEANIIKLLTHICDGTVLIVMFVCYSLVYCGGHKPNPMKALFQSANEVKKRNSKADRIVRNITTQFMAVSVIFSLLSILQVVTQYVEKSKAIISLLQVSGKC